MRSDREAGQFFLQASQGCWGPPALERSWGGVAHPCQKILPSIKAAFQRNFRFMEMRLWIRRRTRGDQRAFKETYRNRSPNALWRRNLKPRQHCRFDDTFVLVGIGGKRPRRGVCAEETCASAVKSGARWDSCSLAIADLEGPSVPTLLTEVRLSETHLGVSAERPQNQGQRSRPASSPKWRVPELTVVSTPPRTAPA